MNREIKITRAIKLLLLVLIFGVILFVQMVSRELVQAADSQKGLVISRVQAESTRIPNPSLPILLEEQREQFEEIAKEFTYPVTRPTTEAANSSVILSAPENFNGKHVVFDGEIIHIASVQKLQENDWSEGYVLIVDDGSAWMPVLYRGDIEHFSVGQHVQIKGAFSASGRGVHADVVILLPGVKDRLIEAPIMMKFSAMALLGVLIVAIGLGIYRKFKWGIFVVCAMILVGCEFRVDTIIHPNGSVTNSIQIMESVENVQFFKEVPGINRYLEGWKDQLRVKGMLVEDYVLKDQEIFLLKNDYPNLESFSRVEGENMTAGSWVYAVAYTSGNRYCYRFIAQVNPKALSETPDFVDNSIANEITRYFNGMIFEYSIQMPGIIEFSNANSSIYNKATWLLDPRRSTELVAETCEEAKDINTDWRWGWLVILGGVFIDLGLIRIARYQVGVNDQ